MKIWQNFRFFLVLTLVAQVLSAGPALAKKKAVDSGEDGVWRGKKNPDVFVQDGELWRDGPQGPKRLTKSNRKIDLIYEAPGGRYLALRKIVGAHEVESSFTPPEEEAKPEMVPEYGILIVDLKKNTILQEISPGPDLGGFLYPSGWTSDTRFRFTGGGPDIIQGTPYEYDVTVNKIREIAVPSK